ncbi:MAG: HPF/RaiA family ribosome-associated protein [bacterium]
MNRKITFQNMDHSIPIEQHVNARLDKISELLKNVDNITPYFQEIFLKANKQHPHHRAELNVKTPLFDLHTHDENPKMYVAIDNAIDKMIGLIKKEKAKIRDKNKKVENEKAEFASDKYTLED